MLACPSRSAGSCDPREMERHPAAPFSLNRSDIHGPPRAPIAGDPTHVSRSFSRFSVLALDGRGAGSRGRVLAEDGCGPHQPLEPAPLTAVLLPSFGKPCNEKEQDMTHTYYH